VTLNPEMIKDKTNYRDHNRTSRLPIPRKQFDECYIGQRTPDDGKNGLNPNLSYIPVPIVSNGEAFHAVCHDRDN